MGNEDSNKKNTTKKKITKKILSTITPVLIGILIVIIITTAVFSVFTAIKDKVIEILSDARATLNKFWKWIRDDYWIKLDETVEITVTNEKTRTRRNKTN